MTDQRLKTAEGECETCGGSGDILCSRGHKPLFVHSEPCPTCKGAPKTPIKARVNP